MKNQKKVCPTLVNYYPLSEAKFNGHCLKNNDISIPKKVNNVYISYILNPCLRDLNTDFTLSNCLFGSVELIKNADPGKYKHSDYIVRFDSCSEFSLTDGSVGTNVVISGFDMSLSVRIDNKKKIF